MHTQPLILPRGEDAVVFWSRPALILEGPISEFSDVTWSVLIGHAQSICTMMLRKCTIIQRFHSHPARADC